MKKFIAYILSTALLLTLFPGVIKAETLSTDINLNLAEDSYVENSVIVTMLSPEDAPLAKEGQATFDKHIEIENSCDFGSVEADFYTDEQKAFLSDKALRVSHIISDKYSTEELMKKLKNSAYVLSVEPDYCMKKMGVTNDLLSDSQWALNGGGIFNNTSSGIHYSQTKQYKASKTPVVAIVDTGIDYTHEDLIKKMWVNPYQNDLPGVYGFDFGDNDIDPIDTDSSSHGTHCAGTIGATINNNAGIAGVTSNVEFMALKVFDSQDKANTSYIINAFNYIYQAQKLGVNVVAVNCSWGGNSSSSALKTIINQVGKAGALFVFAAGNSNNNHDSDTNICPYDLKSPYVVVVGGSSLNDTKASFSDYGKKSVDIFAPAEKIVSTVGAYNFFPALYSSNAQKNITTTFDSCSSSSPMLKTPEEIGMYSPDVSYYAIQHSTSDYFKNSNDGSIYVGYSAPIYKKSSMQLYYDVTDLNINTTNQYYVAFDFAAKKNDDLVWNHIVRSRSFLDFVHYKGRTYILLVNLEGVLGSYDSFYFDNISISKPNASTTSFGKYNCMSGTSMAAPFVSGAVAQLYNAFPKDTVTMRRERLMQCVRKVPALANYCKTSGILDLSKISSTHATPAPKKILVSKIKLNKKKATLKYKKKLKLKATITPSNASNKKVKWSVSKKKYATVSKKGVVKAKKKGIGHTIKVYVKATDGSGKKAVCKIKIKKK